MIQLPNENNVKDRENVPALTETQLQQLINRLNNALHITESYSADEYAVNLERRLFQQLLYRYSNLEHFYSFTGGWEGVNELRDKANGEWISVDDRLPELYVDVLIEGECGEDKFRAVKGYLFDNGDEKLFSICNSDIIIDFKDVTHWQPLPESPKEK